MKDLAFLLMLMALWFVAFPEMLGESARKVSCAYHGTCEQPE